MKQSEKKCYVEFSTGVSSTCPVKHAPVPPFYSELQSKWQRRNPSVTEKPNPHPTVLMEGLYLLSPTGKLCHIPSHCEANLWFMAQRISLQPQQLLSKISLTNHTRSYLKQLTEFSPTHKLPSPRHWEAKSQHLHGGPGMATALGAIGIDWLSLLRNDRASLSA